VPQPNDLLRAARERTPSRRTPGCCMSREELAEAVVLWLSERDGRGRDYAFDAGHLGKIERGIVRRPSPHYVAALCAVLGATEAQLGFSPDGTPVRTPMPTEQPAVEAWELADALTRSTIGMTTLEHMERAALGYAARYPSAPPRSLLASVSGQMTRVSDALGGPQPVRVRRRCVALLGLLAGLAGNLCVDLGQEGRAGDFFDVGELAGQEAEDPDLVAWVLATRSIGPFFAGRYTAAAELLACAEEAARARSSARRRAWIAALRARAAAASGDRDQSLGALDRARQHIDAVDEPPTGTDFFDAPRLHGVAGSAFLLMADSRRAVPLLSQALNHRAAEDTKGRALLTLDLAQCHAAAREPEEAAQLAVTALEAARGTLVRPIVARAQAVHAELDQWRTLPPVRELKARMVELGRGQ
jgi:hypothetical protein